MLGGRLQIFSLLQKKLTNNVWGLNVLWVLQCSFIEVSTLEMTSHIFCFKVLFWLTNDKHIVCYIPNICHILLGNNYISIFLFFKLHFHFHCLADSLCNHFSFWALTSILIHLYDTFNILYDFTFNPSNSQLDKLGVHNHASPKKQWKWFFEKQFKKNKNLWVYNMDCWFDLEAKFQ